MLLRVFSVLPVSEGELCRTSPALSVHSEFEFAEFLQDRETYDRIVVQGKRYSWSSACQSAFDELRKKLTTASILALPDESQPF